MTPRGARTGARGSSARLGIACLLAAAGASAEPVVPDNGAGTADLPLALAYEAESPMLIVDGLPPESVIFLDAVLVRPEATAEVPGGGLGGTQSAAAGSGFLWTLEGIGTLAGYQRELFLPLATVASFPSAPPDASFELHAGPRTPGDLAQAFATDVFRMYGQMIGPGDPDFDLLRITAGSDFGYPSPGSTTLTQAVGGWAADSFFDLGYRIDFVGAPGGPLQGRSGSTTASVRLRAVPEAQPSRAALAALGVLLVCGARRSSHATGWARSS